MNVTNQEVFTRLNRESAPTNVRPDERKGKGNNANLSFSERPDVDLANHLQCQKELAFLISTGELKSAKDVRQWMAQRKGPEVKHAYPTSPLRQGVINSIVSQPYKIMLTIASPTPQADQSQLNNVWFLCGKVSGYYFGRSFTKHHTKGLIGHVAAEPHTFSNHLRGSLNFHILLTQPPEIADIDEFRSVVLGYVPHVKGRNGEPVLDVSMVDVRPVWQDEDGDTKKGLLGLAQYVTKSMEHPQFKNGEYQMPLTPMGIHGIRMRSWKDTTNY